MRELTAAEQAWVEEAVEAAPPLSEQQARLIGALLTTASEARAS